MQDYSVPVRVVQPNMPQRQNSGNAFRDFYEKNKIAVWAIVVSLAVIGAILLVIFHRPGAVVPPKVTLQISAPAQISTATATVYQLTVTNSDTSPISNVSIDVLYPSGFTFQSSSPPASSSDGTTFNNITQLGPGQNAVIAIKGSTAGNNGQVQQINAVMHYQFASASTDFVAQASSQSTISNSGIALQVSGQEQVNNGQVTTYTFGYTNTTANAVSDMAMTVNLPAGFTPTSYVPNPAAPLGQGNSTLTWNLPSLPANGTGSVQIVGAFAGLSTGTQGNFAVQIDGTVAGATPTPTVGSSVNTAPAVLASTTYQVTVVVNPISATLTLQAPTSVDPGTQLSYQLAYQNSGQTAATGINITVTLVGDAYDLTTLSAPMSSITGNTITWNGSQVQQLADLGPNQQGTLSFTIGVKNPATRGDVENMTVTATPSIESDQFQQPFSGTPISTKVNTQLVLDETAAVSSGPNPPTVGQQTTYTVVLGLRNTTNDVNGVVVTASLPEAYNFDPTLVTFVEQKNVTYDPGTRMLTWNVGTVPAQTGDFNPVRSLTLTVVVLPDQSNIGQQMSLLTNVAVTGTDAFTGNQISLTGSKLTTSADPGGNGTVVAQ